MGILRIFLACSDKRLRVALLLLLDHQPGMVVVGMSERLPGLLTQLEGAQPDVMLLEWELPAKPMSELLSDFQTLHCRPKIIVLSSNPESKDSVLAAGADDFIGKNAPPDELLPILRRMKLSETKV